MVYSTGCQQFCSLQKSDFPEACRLVGLVECSGNKLQFIALYESTAVVHWVIDGSGTYTGTPLPPLNLTSDVAVETALAFRGMLLVVLRDSDASCALLAIRQANGKPICNEAELLSSDFASCSV